MHSFQQNHAHVLLYASKQMVFVSRVNICVSFREFSAVVAFHCFILCSFNFFYQEHIDGAFNFSYVEMLFHRKMLFSSMSHSGKSTGEGN